MSDKIFIRIVIVVFVILAVIYAVQLSHPH